MILAGLGFGAGAAWGLTQKYDLRRSNFQGNRIPAVAGLAFVLGGVFIYAYEWFAQGVAVGSAASYLLVTLTFGVLGFCDDLWGDRTSGGLRGHFRALSHGRLTTGAAKAIGGSLVSLVAGGLIGYPVWWRVILAALLIALSANSLNLLDLRPGRCLFAFLLGAALIVTTLLWHHTASVGFLFYIALVAALILYPLDAGGRVMLGDTGANAFGAVFGVAAALLFSPLWQGIIVVLLLAFLAWTEQHSVSQAIEKNAFLRRLDHKIGIR